MFKDLEAARAAFSDFAPDTVVEAFLALLMPVSVLMQPTPEQDIGAFTFVGGTPVMSAELKWPVPPMPEDIEEFVSRGGPTHEPDLRKAIEARLPYSFIGQINLAEAGEPDLPDDGRLLFFYDVATGPWDDGERSAHVIWDQSPTDNLKEFAPDLRLITAETEWNGAVRDASDLPLFDQETLGLMREAGMTDAEIDDIVNAGLDVPAHEDQRVYFGLKRAMYVGQQLQTPVPYNPEWGAFEAAVAKKLDRELAQDELSDIYLDADIGYDTRAAFQLMGLPWPEQDDPRGYAAVHKVLGKMFPSGEEMDARAFPAQLESLMGFPRT